MDSKEEEELHFIYIKAYASHILANEEQFTQYVAYTDINYYFLRAISFHLLPHLSRLLKCLRIQTFIYHINKSYYHIVLYHYHFISSPYDIILYRHIIYYHIIQLPIVLAKSYASVGVTLLLSSVNDKYNTCLKLFQVVSHIN